MARSTCPHPNVNGLRIVADFDHLSRAATTDPASIAEIHGTLLGSLTAFECLVVMLHQLEDKQIRADYLKCLIEPHVTQLASSSDKLSSML